MGHITCKSMGRVFGVVRRCMCKLTLRDILTYFGCQNMTIHVRLILSLPANWTELAMRGGGGGGCLA